MGSFRETPFTAQLRLTAAQSNISMSLHLCSGAGAAAGGATSGASPGGAASESARASIHLRECVRRRNDESRLDLVFGDELIDGERACASSSDSPRRQGWPLRGGAARRVLVSAHPTGAYTSKPTDRHLGNGRASRRKPTVTQASTWYARAMVDCAAPRGRGSGPPPADGQPKPAGQKRQNDPDGESVEHEPGAGGPWVRDLG